MVPHPARAALMFAMTAAAIPGFSQLNFQPVGSPLTLAAIGCSEDQGAGDEARPQAYTAEFKTTTIQTLASGVIITRESTETYATDSQGRTMNSQTVAMRGGNGTANVWFNVEDPVQGTRISWDTSSKQARVIQLPPQDQRQGCWASESGTLRMNFGSKPRKSEPAAAESVNLAIVRPARWAPTREDLGTESVQGLEAHGYRWTMTIPTGQVGNDQPLVTVQESWTAPSLGIEVRHLSESPQSGKTRKELVSLDLSEPPIHTFQPPDGYEVTTTQLHPVACPEIGTRWR